MAKSKPVVPTKEIDLLVKVTWPILERPTKDIRSNILSVLDLIRYQFDNNSITIFHIEVGRGELDGLIIKYGVHMVALNYLRGVDRDTMQIIFLVPSPEKAISKRL